MAREIWVNIRLALAMFMLLAVVYSLAVLGVGQALFPSQANGSLIMRDGTVVGSALIGQEITSPALFHGRPSATVNPVTGRPEPYAANNSGGSSLGPTNGALLAEIRANIEAARIVVPTGPIPANLVESSASGLDPEITLGAALAQVSEIAARNRIPVATLRSLVMREATPPTLGLYGTWRVNVLRLDLALERLVTKK